MGEQNMKEKGSLFQKLFSTKPEPKRVESLPPDEIINALNKQLEEKAAARSEAQGNQELTPEVLEGKKRKYHYKDVEIRVRWEYGGRYGKTLKDLGVKPGDPVHLSPEPLEDDPENVSVYWNGTKIGFMKTNRMRNMVSSWRAAGYPVAAFVNTLNDAFDVLLEIAFYGYVKKS